MQTFNNAEMAFLSLLCYPKLAIKSLKLCANNANLFPSAVWPHLSLLWDSYLKLLTNNKGKGLELGKDIVIANLTEAVSSDRNMPNELIEKCDTLLQRYKDGDAPTEEEGLVFIKKVAQLDTGRKLMASISSNADFQALEAVINKSKAELESLDSGTQIADQVIYSPLRDIESIAVTQRRVPTGINWLDEITSGGGREGEMWLVLGPSGGGKSMWTVQYACGQALMGNSVFWATAEQSLTGDLAERIISNVTDESLDRIRDKGFNNLDEDIQRKFWASVAGADEKLIVMDLARYTPNMAYDPKDYGGVYSVWQEVKKKKAEGHVIKTVIIDWLGAMLNNVSANTGRQLESAFQFMAQAEIDVARQMAKDEHLLVIILHQTDTKSQHARPIYIPDKTCALNMHSMANYFDICITLSNRDSHNILWISAVKSRRGNTISVTCKLIGDKCKFVYAPGWYPNTDGNFYNPAEVELTPQLINEDEVTPFSREIE